MFIFQRINGWDGTNNGQHLLCAFDLVNYSEAQRDPIYYGTNLSLEFMFLEVLDVLEDLLLYLTHEGGKLERVQVLSTVTQRLHQGR